MNPEKPVIGLGCEVTLHFSIRLGDGTVAECTERGEPHTFVVGDGSMVAGLETSLYGLRRGARQQLLLAPDQAFGHTDPEKVHTLRRAELDPLVELEPGTIVGFATPAGHELAGTVLEWNEEEVTVDFNHPLAGHTVLFEVEIVDVVPAGGGDPAQS